MFLKKMKITYYEHLLADKVMKIIKNQIANTVDLNILIIYKISVSSFKNVYIQASGFIPP